MVTSDVRSRAGREWSRPSAVAVEELFDHLRRTGSRSTREQLIRVHLPLAEVIAHDYDHRGVDHDDLSQVAMVGLVKAIDGYDPTRRNGFSPYASATINGELKRHFRDAGWAVRPPRALQEAHLRVRDVTEAFLQDHGRSPEPTELAELTGLPVARVRDAQRAGAAYRPAPIEPRREDGASPTAGARLAEADRDLASADSRMVVEGLLEVLPPREATILRLRFYDELPQVAIAARVGISQMHVSRLIRRSLAELREAIGTDWAEEVVA